MWIKNGFNGEYATGQGNNRVTQPLGSRKMSMGSLDYQFESTTSGDGKDNGDGKNILIIFLILVVVGMCVAMGLMMKSNSQAKYGENGTA